MSLMKSFYIYTFGCRVNQAESERLSEELVKLGLALQEKRPDIFVINSCAVTHKAVAEVKKMVNFVKRNYPDTYLVLTGCSANYWLKLQKDPVLKKLDLVVPNSDKEYLAKILKKRFNLAKQNRQTSYSLPVDKYTSSFRLLIKIQDGCHRFCTFCIVPYLRGLPQSRRISEIVKGIKENESWAKEAILTAINTEAFGKDTGEKFTDLIKQVLKKTSIKRISFGSIHPWSLNKEFVSLYQDLKDSDRFVHYFHIPLQSGSNKILNLMKREYKAEEVFERINHLYKLNPYIFFGTDVIVGFLEEEDSDFEKTYEFLEKSPFVKFHVFRFSIRSHTAAYYLAKRLKKVDEKTKKRRAEALHKLSKRKMLAFFEKLKGKVFPALFLSKKEDGAHHATLINQVPVIVPTEEDFTGRILDVKIEGVKKGRLVGKVLNSKFQAPSTK